MNIKDIAGRSVKIGRTSITVKDECGKTCGVVTGITKFTDLRPNVQVDYFKQLRESGIWGSRIDGIMNCVVLKDGELYYLNNTQPLRTYEKYFKGNRFESEEKHYNLRLQIAENAKKIATVIDCEVSS